MAFDKPLQNKECKDMEVENVLPMSPPPGVLATMTEKASPPLLPPIAAQQEPVQPKVVAQPLQMRLADQQRVLLPQESPMQTKLIAPRVVLPTGKMTPPPEALFPALLQAGQGAHQHIKQSAQMGNQRRHGEHFQSEIRLPSHQVNVGMVARPMLIRWLLAKDRRMLTRSHSHSI